METVKIKAKEHKGGNMEKDKAHHYNLCRRIDAKINQLLAEADAWRTVAENATTTLTGMPRGGCEENPRELAICNIIDCEQEADRLIDLLYDLKEGAGEK